MRIIQFKQSSSTDKVYIPYGVRFRNVVITIELLSDWNYLLKTNRDKVESFLYEIDRSGSEHITHATIDLIVSAKRLTVGPREEIIKLPVWQRMPQIFRST